MLNSSEKAFDRRSAIFHAIAITLAIALISGYLRLPVSMSAAAQTLHTAMRLIK